MIPYHTYYNVVPEIYHRFSGAVPYSIPLAAGYHTGGNRARLFNLHDLN